MVIGGGKFEFQSSLSEATHNNHFAMRHVSVILVTRHFFRTKISCVF